MSAISTTGARIVRSGNGRPARRRHLRLVGALKVKRSFQSLYLEASITFISWPHDAIDQILAPYSHFDRCCARRTIGHHGGLTACDGLSKHSMMLSGGLKS